MARIAVIDDTAETAASLSATLSALLGDQHEVVAHGGGTLAGDFVRDAMPDVVFMSLELKDVDGMALLTLLARQPDGPPIVAVVYERGPRPIVDATRAGAFDVIVRPVCATDVQASCLRAITARMSLGREAVGRDISGCEALSDLVGSSPAMERLRGIILKVASSDSPVLIVGESGVGKELVARAVHRLSGRSDGPYVARNCGAFPEQLFESEMFGTELGAYTGAIRRAGAFELANGGTLFLDEVGELAPANQVTLLRAIENGKYHRVGGTDERRTDIRVVAATNRDLKHALADGDFRADLYYRLNVLQVTIPPLRQRREDIPLLVDHFSREVMEAAEGRRFSGDALARLSDYDWPGNIRELRNVVHRSAVYADSIPVSGADIHFG